MNIYTKYIALLLCLIINSTAKAAYVYTYQGNNYNYLSGSTWDTSMSISGSIVLDTALGSNFNGSVSFASYSFTDGYYTYTNLNSTNGPFNFITDSSGNITNWTISLAQPAITDLALGDLQNTLQSTQQLYASDSAQIWECTEVTGSQCTTIQTGGNYDSAYVADDAGTWSVSTVPIPSALWLFSSGLFGFISMARHKYVAN